MVKLFTNPFLYLFLILVLGFYVRLYKIDNPVADWHSWRQADTAAVARNFYKEGYNPFLPRGDDMSDVSSRGQNLNRYRLVEFPIYNSLVYFAYLINGGVDERLARLVTIFISLGSTIFIYLITKKELGELTALMSAFFFAILPYNIYYSRVILPDPLLIFFCLGMFYFTKKWIFKNSSGYFWLGVSFAAGAFLTKPVAIFYVLPLFYSYYKKEQTIWPIKKRYLVFVTISTLPFLLWRTWIGLHPEGIPSFWWLLNGNHIRFRPSFWRWIIGDRFGREILSAAGSFLFFLGLVIRPKEKEGWLLHLLALSAFLYLIVFATGNVQHDYYQIFIIPPLVIFLSRGIILLIKGEINFIPRIWTALIAVLFAILTIYLTWGEVKGLYQVNNWAIVDAGKEANKILPKDALVLAPYGGDTAFLYQINRHGWPEIPLSIPEMVKNYKVSYYVSVTRDSLTSDLVKGYAVIKQTPSFVIIDLTRQIK